MAEEPYFTTIHDKPVIVINPGEYQFYLGTWKAKKIIESISEIRVHISTYYNKATLKHANLNHYKLPKLTIGKESKYPIELSMYKCLSIISNLESIKSFINKYA